MHGHCAENWHMTEVDICDVRNRTSTVQHDRYFKK